MYINPETIKKIENYGKKTICYVLNGKGMDKNCSLSVVMADELIELDGGRELLRKQSKTIPNNFKLHGNELDFNIIYATPKTKKIAKKIANKYKATLIMIYN